MHDAKVSDDPLQYWGNGHARHAVCESFGREPDGQDEQLGMLKERNRGRVQLVQLAPPGRVCDPGPHSLQLAMELDRNDAEPQDKQSVKAAFGSSPSAHCTQTVSVRPRTNSGGHGTHHAELLAVEKLDSDPKPHGRHASLNTRDDGTVQVAQTP